MSTATMAAACRCAALHGLASVFLGEYGKPSTSTRTGHLCRLALADWRQQQS